MLFRSTTPLQPAFQPPTDAFNFSPPVQATSESYSIIPGYAKIIFHEPTEIRQHANPNYRVICHAAALVGEALKESVYSIEGRQAREALEEARTSAKKAFSPGATVVASGRRRCALYLLLASTTQT